jgi:hypothetical protein
MSDMVQPLGSHVLVRIESEDHLIIESTDLLAILRDGPATAAAAAAA